METGVSADGLDAHVVVHRSAGFSLDLSIQIAPGTTAALLGPNGAGKSTAVAAISGLLPIDRGRIVLGGATLDDPSAKVFTAADRRLIGVVFQDHLLFPHLTVIENVAFGLRSRGVARDQALERAREWIDRLELTGLERHRPRSLSGGQAQRVALARALVTEPDLLLLDEPLSSLDVTTRTTMRHVLAEHLSTFAGPRLLITHDPAEAFLLADMIHILEAGAVTQTGTADDIRLHPYSPYAADLAGSNLLTGTAGHLSVDVGGHRLSTAVEHVVGPALVSIHPSAVSVHSSRPGGSPRNSWRTTVERLEHLGATVRLRTGDPLPVTAEITESAASELGLEVGADVWIAIKATELGIRSDRGEPNHND